MKKYEKPNMNYLALSSVEDMAALLDDFDSFAELTPHVYSYLSTSAKTFKTV